MKARWLLVCNAVAALCGYSGCATSAPNLKTPVPERFALPPTDDARFSEPIAYPKDTLNQDQVIKPGNPKLPSQAPPLTSPTQGGRYGGGGGGPAGPNF